MRRIVIVGGGWAGFSAADALSTSSDAEIILLDARARVQARGAGAPRAGRPVEAAGLHGFWREYRNTFAAIERIGLKLDQVLTPYVPSILVSESGKVAVAPVMLRDGTESVDSQVLSQLPEPLQQLVKLMPPPLDLALLSDFNSASPLSLLDRLSAVGLLGVWADFVQDERESWKRYDSISAEHLFLATAGVTPTLYRELVSPLLHVLPMTPGYDCSAAAALSCFHVFALQSKGAFDVRWCRGSIAEKIFKPWASLLQARGVEIRGSSKVTSITSDSSSTRKYLINVHNDSESIECDAIIMAVGGTAMKRLVPQCPPLQTIPINWNKLRGVTCVAVRLFLKPSPVITTYPNGDSTQLHPSMAHAMREAPAVVCGPRVLPKDLAETGFCIYDLQRLQDDFAPSRNTATAALEVDYFRADSLAAKSDEEIVAVTLRAVAAALAVTPLDRADVIDFSVVRARDAVSHFCVDSASTSPNVKLTSGGDVGLYICGDWIDRTGHASWSTEKAVVTGRQAAQAVAVDFGLSGVTADVIPVPPDSAQLAALRQFAKTARALAPSEVIPAAPWMLYQQLRGLLQL
ncbi:hypothetical protein MHU86_11997 [Fragilaria crotonensis]|nr:hypothetical protein MHU86_11997 [Fragilaria crotonensis]